MVRVKKQISIATAKRTEVRKRNAAGKYNRDRYGCEIINLTREERLSTRSFGNNLIELKQPQLPMRFIPRGEVPIDRAAYADIPALIATIARRPAQKQIVTVIHPDGNVILVICVEKNNHNT